MAATQATADSLDGECIRLLCEEIDAKFPTEDDVTQLAEAMALAAFGEPEDPSKVQKVECVSCQDRHPVVRTWQAPCNHHYCIACIEELHRASLEDETLFPPRCCQHDMPWDEVRAIIEDELEAAFEAKREELGTRNRTYCSDATCAIFIGYGHIVNGVATCPKCQKTTCITCKARSHSGDCLTDDELEKTLALAGDEGWRRCEECRSLVELNTGCNHIT